MSMNLLWEWIQDPSNHDQDQEGKQVFLQSGKYETSRLQATGISNTSLKKRAVAFYKDHKVIDFDSLVDEIDEIMTSSTSYEYQIISIYLLEKYHRQFTQELFDLINQNWIDLIDYWAISDHLSMNVFTYFPLEEEYYQISLQSWLDSNHYWRRRQGLTAYVKRSRNNADLFYPVLESAKQLLPDDNYYIRKAISWVIREAYRKHPQYYKDVYDFVYNHISYFTKTMLRETIRYLDDDQQSDLLHHYDHQ